MGTKLLVKNFLWPLYFVFTQPKASDELKRSKVLPISRLLFLARRTEDASFRVSLFDADCIPL
jgi:hypothetical protein